MSDGNFNNPGSSNPADQTFGRGVPVQQPPPGGPLPNMGGNSTPGAPGAPGTPGSVWYEGAGAPASGLGIVGDFYLNTSTGGVYQKTTSGWGAPITNLKGAPGIPGMPGGPGPPGPPGPIADTATIYWANHLDNTIMRQSPGGASVVFASGQNAPAGVSCDGVNVYWVNQGDSTIMRLSVAGGTPTVFASSQNNPFFVSSDGVNVYWTNDGDGTVMQLSVAGGVPVIFASGQGTPTGICSDGTNVYWARADNNTIMQLGVGGGTPTVFVSGLATYPIGVFSDGANVYWVNVNWLDVNDSMIMYLPVGGGTPTVLASGQRWLIGVCSDGIYVYWTSWSNGTVTRLSVSGGTPTVIISGQNGPQGIATNLLGPPGTPGSVWYEGAGTPASGLGISGDFYLNTTTGDVYQKTGGGWGAPIANITGPPGPQGIPGNPGQVITYFNPLSADNYAININIGSGHNSGKLHLRALLNGTIENYSHIVGLVSGTEPVSGGNVAVTNTNDGGSINSQPWIELVSAGPIGSGIAGAVPGDSLDLQVEWYFPRVPGMPITVRWTCSYLTGSAGILARIICNDCRCTIVGSITSIGLQILLDAFPSSPSTTTFDHNNTQAALVLDGY